MENGAVRTEQTTKMPKHIFRLAVILTIAGILLPDGALAWGAGVHVAQGSFILDNLHMIKPQIASVLAAHPLDYIYGCISADIFIGKGYRRRDDHCHNWSIGMKVLADSSDGPTTAYAYGYLSHLAADVIAHNYFIPNLLYSTPTTKGLGHVYWEFRADRFISRKHWSLASKVVNMHNHGNDTLIKKVMKRSRLRFGAKKMVFKRAVRLSDLIVWKEHVEHARNGWRVTRDDVVRLNNHSLNLVVDLLLNEGHAECLRHDPVGTDNTIEAKVMRKTDILSARGIGKDRLVFEMPESLKSLNYVDHETVRI